MVIENHLLALSTIALTIFISLAAISRHRDTDSLSATLLLLLLLFLLNDIVVVFHVLSIFNLWKLLFKIVYEIKSTFYWFSCIWISNSLLWIFRIRNGIWLNDHLSFFIEHIKFLRKVWQVFI